MQVEHVIHAESPSFYPPLPRILCMEEIANSSQPFLPGTDLEVLL